MRTYFLTSCRAKKYTNSICDPTQVDVEKDNSHTTTADSVPPAIISRRSVNTYKAVVHFKFVTVNDYQSIKIFIKCLVTGL